MDREDIVKSDDSYVLVSNIILRLHIWVVWISPAESQQAWQHYHCKPKQKTKRKKETEITQHEDLKIKEMKDSKTSNVSLHGINRKNVGG
jgi:hypothetical protein